MAQCKVPIAQGGSVPAQAWRVAAEERCLAAESHGVNRGALALRAELPSLACEARNIDLESMSFVGRVHSWPEHFPQAAEVGGSRDNGNARLPPTQVRLGASVAMHLSLTVESRSLADEAPRPVLESINLVSEARRFNAAAFCLAAEARLPQWRGFFSSQLRLPGPLARLFASTPRL